MRPSRVVPAKLCEIERKVEEHCDKVIADVHTRSDVAVYLLTSAAHTIIASHWRRKVGGVPTDSSTLLSGMEQVHRIARKYTSGLQFALYKTPGDVNGGRFRPTSLNITDEMKRKAGRAVELMADYVDVRDYFLTYRWGGYDVDLSTNNSVKFVDPPGRRGGRDRAQQLVAQKIEAERAIESMTRIMPLDPLPTMGARSQLDFDIPMDGITAEECRDCWLHLQHLVADLMNNLAGTMLFSTGQMVRTLSSRVNLSPKKVMDFVEYVQFDRQAHKGALTLFHCPLVPITKSTLVPFAAGIIFSDLRTTIPRLAIHRGTEYNRSSQGVEEAVLSRIAQQFDPPATAVTRVPYSSKDDQGDIDLAVYEPATNRLLVGMVKSFVYPDSVAEVYATNDELEKAIEQLERARNWVTTLDHRSLAFALRMAAFDAMPAIHYVALGRGLAGSDYLQIPDWVSVVDIEYLLRQRLKGGSVFDAIDSFEEFMRKEGEVAEGETRYVSLRLGDISFELPGWHEEIA